eukprot:11313051-Ditylum_brightwellii.AAC.1
MEVLQMEWAILAGSLLQTASYCGKDMDSHRDTQDIWNHFKLKAQERYQCLDSSCNLRDISMSV